MSHATDNPAGREPTATTAQLRDDIDSGRTGDKIGGFDPAAAPLGADDEAAGTPPSPQVIAQARRDERRMNTARMNSAEPALAPNGDTRTPVRVGIVLGAAAALAIGGVVLLAL